MTDETPVVPADALDPNPPVVEVGGKYWMLFDGFEVAPHSEGGVMVIFAYRGKANVVIRIPSVTIASATDDPDASVLRVVGIEGRQEVAPSPFSRPPARLPELDAMGYPKEAKETMGLMRDGKPADMLGSGNGHGR
jgi:hypothetical protein